ncbi:MAG: hypothetical protein KIS67_21270 [Verrucomicrobiae bacterium]|nr:hypothetical protein [Verrucomicrobiae bacterium]
MIQRGRRFVNVTESGPPRTTNTIAHVAYRPGSPQARSKHAPACIHGANPPKRTTVNPTVPRDTNVACDGGAA